MAKIQLLAGSTSNTINLFVQDSSSTVGAGLSGLAYNTSGLTAYYALPKAAPVAITLATQTVTGAFSSGGFVELDATHCKGLYRLDIPDAAVAAGRFANIYLYGATNMAPVVLEIELTATNNQSAAAFITGINSLAPPTNWNLLSIDGSGLVNIIQAAADKVWSTAVRILTAGTNIVLAKGTGLTGLNDIAATAVVSNGAITTLGGKVSEVALTDTLTTYTGNTPQTGDSYARIGSTGSGLTSLAPASTALSTAQWTNARAGYLDLLNTYLDAAVSGVAAAVWAVTTRTLSAFGFSVTVGTNTDKTGYSLSQSFPSNFASMAITAGGAVTAGTVSDKTGYAIGTGGITSTSFANNSITSSALAASAITAIWANVVESVGSYTAQQVMSIILAAVAGGSSGSGLTFKTPDGSVTRVIAVVDGSNNRTSMTLTPSS